ncbi:MAG TPA: AAA family ATPase [Acidimicrobiales bacterium]
MPIVPIQIKKGDTRTTYKTILSYGRSRSGKTRFAATFPRPRFFSEASERGWTTLETMPSEQFFEPDRPPEVWPIENAEEMAEAFAKTKADVYEGRILTIVIDSLTFYSDAYFDDIFRRASATAGNRAVDKRALYGALAQHLQNLRTDIHRWPCNVVWLALEKTPGEDNPLGGPLLTGQTAQKFPAGCDHVFYHRAYTGNFQNEENGKVEAMKIFEMRTAPFGPYLAGGRDSGMLPDPIIDPSYRQLMEYLELPDPLTVKPKAQPPRPAPAVMPAKPATAAPAAAPSGTVVRRTVATPSVSNPARRS